jgi:hypothetical protein
MLLRVERVPESVGTIILIYIFCYRVITTLDKSETQTPRERMSESNYQKPRNIKLFCPSLSKTACLAVWDEQRLDLGSIALTFGLDPLTLKLNGHFISRGLDHIASSLTWNSLLSFFSARGFSTGINHQHPLLVDGRLIKLGSKRRRKFFLSSYC